MNHAPSPEPNHRKLLIQRSLGGLFGFVLAVALVLFANSPDVSAAASRILVDGENFPAGFTVPAGEIWEFDASADTQVTTSGNVVVLGTLRMRPSSRSVDHFLQFTGIDESKFVGGGMTHVDAPHDIGLWVEGAGVLDISGTPTTPWSYQWESGWSSADDIVAGPNTEGDYETFTQVDSASDVPEANELGYETELLNLTRNVRIEGTPDGKTHILVHAPDADIPQTVEYAAIRYVAPWIGEFDKTGRYGLHLHHNGYATQGSSIKGVVIRDAGNHAFVPHASHGVTFTDTIAYNTAGAAYWWDPSGIDVCGDRDGCNETFDLVYDSIVVANGQPTPIKKHTLTAIWMGGGENITIHDSVVVGMNGRSGANSSAFEWPGRDRGVWNWTNNIAHNNIGHGIFVWQNTGGDVDENHVIDQFTAYYNAGAGVDHGAYGNAYIYTNLTLLENAQGPELNEEQYGSIQSHALGKQSLTTDGPGATDTQEWNGIVTGGGKLLVFSHNTPGKAVRFLFCEFSEIVFDEGTLFQGGYDFIECNLNVEHFDREGIHPGTVIRVQDGDTAYQLTGTGAKQRIPTFYDNPQPPVTTTTMAPPTTTTTTTEPPPSTTTTTRRCRRCG